jgi:glycosyltransferase involved in cell wall biosynthesis
MKRILLLDLATTGHHPRYVKWILGCEACGEGNVVLAGRSDLFNHVELRDIAGKFQRYTVRISKKQERILSNTSSTRALIRRQFAFWQIWRRTYDEVNRLARVDVVVMCFAEDCLDAIAVRGSPFRTAPWTGITFKPTFHFARIGVSAPRARLSRLKGWLFRRALRARFLTGLLTIDPTLDKYADFYLSKSERQKLVFLPDAAPEHVLPPRAMARESLGIPLEAKVVLIYGALSERKGVCALVESTNSSECPPNIYLLLAGKQSPGITAFLAGHTAKALTAQNRLKVINAYASEGGEALLLAVTDCMWVGYRGFYTMSAVLVLAARHGIPCMVSADGIAGYLAKIHNFGWIVDPENAESVVAALRQVSREPGDLAAKGQRGASAFSRHSIKEFQKAMSQVIAGMGPDSERKIPRK